MRGSVTKKKSHTRKRSDSRAKGGQESRTKRNRQKRFISASSCSKAGIHTRQPTPHRENEPRREREKGIAIRRVYFRTGVDNGRTSEKVDCGESNSLVRRNLASDSNGPMVPRIYASFRERVWTTPRRMMSVHASSADDVTTPRSCGRRRQRTT